jgi:hypothetical protein
MKLDLKLSKQECEESKRSCPGSDGIALTPRHMMLERGVRSNEAKNVTLEDEAIDMRVGSDRF